MYPPAPAHQMIFARRMSGSSLQSNFVLSLPRKHFTTAGSTTTVQSYPPRNSCGFWCFAQAPNSSRLSLLAKATTARTPEQGSMNSESRFHSSCLLIGPQ